MNFENFDMQDCMIITKAVKSRSAENVEKVIASLLSHGHDITQHLCTPDQQGYSALHYAVLYKDLAMVKRLLMHADKRCINLESHDRSTALLLLCRNCSASDLEEEILASLLHAGANPNLPGKDPFSLPLLCALERRWWRGAELMLDAGADATATDSEHNKRPATFFARDNVEILMKLLSGGCDCPDLYDWIISRSLTDAQLKTIFPHILSHPGINKLDVLRGAVWVSYHESAVYILEHCEFCTMYQYTHIISDILKLNNGINWADKNKYITALMKNIFMSKLDKNDLLTSLFLQCARCCWMNKVEDCCGSCDVNVEQIWINLEHILRLAEHNGLPIEKWRLSGRLPITQWEWLGIDHNVLNLVLYETTLCSVPLVLKLLPLMKQDGCRLTVSSAAAFLCSRCIRRLSLSLQKTDVDIQAIVHSPESPYRVLLSELTRNCCEEGRCWFRSPMMTGLCRRGIEFGCHFRVLMLLHLGVHELFLKIRQEKISWNIETEITRAPAGSRRLVFSIVHRYAPRWKLRTRCRDEVRRPWKYRNRPENVVASKLNQMAPLRSLKELCRLSIRASLGHCRIEEKTEGLRDVLPAPLREYLYFRHDFLIFPRITQLPI
ncbi:uncharacterized protein LOC108683377 [Hyalella azteca]|uniref:Uncharacterized protein LOC108683377 n=1 Tax=Hyalella azteca TaxID=294128 RepID=A0A8B7PQA3_HYAAZ|nr:uncharacterized protein LOC108683377 [Hyalella azteca]